MPGTDTMKRANLRAEHGQTWVMFAVMLPLILFIAVLSVDVGNWWVHKKRLQTQVDAGALAAGPLFNECFRDDDSVANARISTEALKYVGDFHAGRDPEDLPDQSPPSLNQQVQEPGDVYAALNSARYWQRGATGQTTDASTGYGLDYTMDRVPFRVVDGVTTPDPSVDLPSDPCGARFLDVKATDDEVFPLWGRIQYWRDFPLSVSPRTHAKVEARKLQGLSGFLPWAVPEVNPRTVAALFVDQLQTDKIHSVTLLGGPSDPNDTETLNGEPAVRWNGLASVDVVEQTGMIVFTSRQELDYDDFADKSLSAICAMRTAACYGGNTNTSGIEFIRGTPLQDPNNDKVDLITAELTTFPHPDEEVLDPTNSCATADPVPNSSPYFLYNANCRFRIRAKIEFGDLGNPRIVRVGGNRQCNSGIVDLVLRDTWWESEWLPTVAKGSRRNGYTLCWRAGNKGNSPSGNFGGQMIQMAYAANQSVVSGSGPIVYSSVRKVISPAGCGTYANALDITAQAICVDVGLQPPLRVVDPGDPPLFLRIHGGSLNQMLDCDASPRGPDEEIRDGCFTPYQVNTRDFACEPYRPSNLPPNPLPPPDPDPWPDCIEANPGTVTSMSAGLKARFEDPLPIGANCSPNLWDQYRSKDELPPSTDPRVVTLVIAEYGTFADSEGIKVLPITKFAGFYVTGWFTKQANDKDNSPKAVGCPDNDDPPPPPAARCDGGQCDSDDNEVQGAVWGYFITQAYPFPGGRPAPQLCDFEQFDTCITNLVE